MKNDKRQGEWFRLRRPEYHVDEDGDARALAKILTATRIKNPGRYKKAMAIHQCDDPNEIHEKYIELRFFPEIKDESSYTFFV